MIIQLLAVALILGIAFFQVTQGIFSSLIMAILSVVSAVVAFNFYEPLAEMMYNSQPAHADAAALIVMFAIPLLMLRMIFDKIIRGNVVMGMWVDRIGGGLLGLISGTFIVGMLLIAIQMMPFGPSAMGFTPFTDTFERDQRAYADEFVVGAINLFSKGSLRTGKPFEDTHDDLLFELYCARNRMVQKYRDDNKKEQTKYVGRISAKPDSLRVMGIYLPGNIEEVADDTPQSALLTEVENARSKVVIVRVAVSEDARDEEDNWWRLPATHFRMVTVNKEGKTRSYYPVAYLTCREAKIGYQSCKNYGQYENHLAFANWELIIPTKSEKSGKLQFGKLVVCRKWYLEGGPKELIVDWVYRIPEVATPKEIIFRRVAKVRLPKAKTVDKGGEKLPPKEGGLARREDVK